jgi:hypothetical protein
VQDDRDLIDEAGGGKPLELVARFSERPGLSCGFRKF